MSKAVTTDNRQNQDIRSCKLFYLLKYAAGLVFILSAAFIPLWLFLSLCLFLLIASMTPVLPKIASLFNMTEKDKIRRLSFDFRILVGITALGFAAFYFIENQTIGFGFDLPSFLIFQALAVTIFSTRSFYSLFHKVTLYENLRQNESFKNISLLYEFFLIMLRVLGAFFAGVWVSYFTGYDLTVNLLNQLFFIAIIGAFVGSLFESIPSKINSNASIYLSSFFSMWFLYLLNYQTPFSETALAALFSVVLAFLAYRYKIADVSALFSAAVLGVLIILFTNIWWFVLLVAFFVLGGGFTKYKFRQKEACRTCRIQNRNPQL
jgi:Predicted membrane protein